MRDDVVVAFDALVPGGVRSGVLVRGDSGGDGGSGGDDGRGGDGGGRALRWFEAGSGDLTVVLDSGAGSPAPIWASVLARLAGHARVITYDRAGYGRSDEATPLTLSVAIGDLTAIVAELGVGASGKACVLVGHSWGGLLVQMVAWERPDLVAGLVLVDPSHEQFWAGLAPDVLAGLLLPDQDADSTGSGDGSSEQMSEARENAEYATQDPAIQQLLIAAELSYTLSENWPRAYAAEMSTIVASVDEMVGRRAAAGPVTVPTVLLTAMKGRPEEFRARVLELQENVVEAMPRGRHEVVLESGHYIHAEMPQLVADTILDVLREGGA